MGALLRLAGAGALLVSALVACGGSDETQPEAEAVTQVAVQGVLLVPYGDAVRVTVPHWITDVEVVPMPATGATDSDAATPSARLLGMLPAGRRLELTPPEAGSAAMSFRLRLGAGNFEALGVGQFVLPPELDHRPASDFPERDDDGTQSAGDGQGSGTHEDVAEEFGLSTDVAEAARRGGMSVSEFHDFVQDMKSVGGLDALGDDENLGLLADGGGVLVLTGQVREHFDIPPDVGINADASTLVFAVATILEVGGDTSDARWFENFGASVREAMDIPQDATADMDVVSLLDSAAMLQQGGKELDDAGAWDQVIKAQAEGMDQGEIVKTLLTGDDGGGSNVGVGGGPSGNTGGAGDSGSPSQPGAGTHDSGGEQPGAEPDSGVDTGGGSSGDASQTQDSGGDPQWMVIDDPGGSGAKVLALVDTLSNGDTVVIYTDPTTGQTVVNYPGGEVEGQECQPGSCASLIHGDGDGGGDGGDDESGNGDGDGDDGDGDGGGDDGDDDGDGGDDGDGDDGDDGDGGGDDDDDGGEDNGTGDSGRPGPDHGVGGNIPLWVMVAKGQLKLEQLVRPSDGDPPVTGGDLVIDDHGDLVEKDPDLASGSGGDLVIDDHGDLIEKDPDLASGSGGEIKADDHGDLIDPVSGEPGTAAPGGHSGGTGEGVFLCMGEERRCISYREYRCCPDTAENCAVAEQFVAEHPGTDVMYWLSGHVCLENPFVPPVQSVCADEFVD